MPYTFTIQRRGLNKLVSAKKDERKTVVIVFKKRVTWKKGEEFGDFVTRLREKYAEANDVKTVSVIVA